MVTMPQKPASACGHRTCPNLRPCPTHARQAERARGTRQQRGYTSQHDQLRQQWKPRVDAGLIDCRSPHCIAPIRRILPGEPWDLGHTEDRKGWRGPEHRLCNRSEGGKAAHPA